MKATTSSVGGRAPPRRNWLQPAPQGLDADTELAGDSGSHAVGGGIGPFQIEDHAHGTLLQLRRVPLRCGVLLFHDSNLSKVWSLQETQAGSPSLEEPFSAGAHRYGSIPSPWV